MSKFDLSAFTIRIASGDQNEQLWRAAFVPWGRGRTYEDFKAEQIECKRLGTWMGEGAFRSWVLVKREEMDGEIYAGCETFRRKSLLKRSRSNDVEEVYSYGIASVVTPVSHHRNGYATHLLRLLHYQIGDPSFLPPFPPSWGLPPPALSEIDRSQVPPAIASILFSDVGSSFYERVTIGQDRPGWIVTDEECQQITWKLCQPSDVGDKRKWDWIYRSELSRVGEQLSAASRKQMLKMGEAGTVWAPDPATPGTLSFVPSRAMWNRPAEWPYTPETEPCGIRLPASRSGGEDSIVLFSISEAVIGRALLIYYIHGLDADSLPTLLTALDEAAVGTGIEEGMVWDVQPGGILGKAWLSQEGREGKGGKRTERMGHLLGVTWYGNPEGRGKVVDAQMWSWC